MPDYAPCSVMAFEVQFSGPLFMDRHYGLGNLLSFLNVPISQGGEGFNDCHVEVHIAPHSVGIEGFLSCPCVVAQMTVGGGSTSTQFCGLGESVPNAVPPLMWELSLRQLEGLMNVIKVVHTVFIWIYGRGDVAPPCASGPSLGCFKVSTAVVREDYREALR